jgi:hypothetical protein
MVPEPSRQRGELVVGAIARRTNFPRWIGSVWFERAYVASSDIRVSTPARRSGRATGLTVVPVTPATPHGAASSAFMNHSGNPQMLTAMDRWEAALVARLIERLHHPVILVGGLGVMIPGGEKVGLLRGGRYLSFPPGMRAISDLFVSVLQTLGIDMPKFGDPAICQGPLPGARA